MIDKNRNWNYFSDVLVTRFKNQVFFDNQIIESMHYVFFLLTAFDSFFLKNNESFY